MARRHWSPCLMALLVMSGSASVSSPVVRSVPSPWKQALGRCWQKTEQRSLGLGEDINTRYYATPWYAGAIHTTIEGMPPHARYWSLTLYPAHLRRLFSVYDQQLIQAQHRRPFRVVIGRAGEPGPATQIDPAASGDTDGILIYRVYGLSGHMPPLPRVTFTGTGAIPPALASCTRVQAELYKAVARQRSVPLPTLTQRILWPDTTSSPTWSIASHLPPVGDPNDVYHLLRFDVTDGDLVLHGTLPPISTLAPARGMRYFSLCAYVYSNPTKHLYTTLACLDDTAITVGRQRDYIVVVSPDRPVDTDNWLNPEQVTAGVIMMRWLLPQGGLQASFCVPAITYRTPGDTTIPLLPQEC